MTETILSQMQAAKMGFAKSSRRVINSKVCSYEIRNVLNVESVILRIERSQLCQFVHAPRIVEERLAWRSCWLHPREIDKDVVQGPRGTCLFFSWCGVSRIIWGCCQSWGISSLLPLRPYPERKQARKWMKKHVAVMMLVWTGGEVLRTRCVVQDFKGPTKDSKRVFRYSTKILSKINVITKNWRTMQPEKFSYRRYQPRGALFTLKQITTVNLRNDRENRFKRLMNLRLAWEQVAGRESQYLLQYESAHRVFKRCL